MSEQFPELWLLALGSLFIVVVAFLDGLAGIYRRSIDPMVDRLLPWLRRSREAAPAVPLAILPAPSAK